MKHKFTDVYIEYLNYIEYRQKEQSKKTLKDTFNNKILPFFSEYCIEDITDDVYTNWQLYIDKFNYSNNYRKRLHYSMVAFYDYLLLYNIIDVNIPKRVGNFKLVNKKVKYDYYTYKEFKLFIKYVEDVVYREFFEFMFFTGCRPGEAMALRFSDLDNRVVSINKTISEHTINGSRVIASPKTISSNRDIVLDARLYNNLLKLKKYYISKYNEDFDYYIFGGIKPLAPTSINRYKLLACSKANIRPIKLHEFRHSHASLLYDNGIDSKSIKERLGHSSIATTMNVYVHLNKRHQKRVLRTLNLLRLIF